LYITTAAMKVLPKPEKEIVFYVVVVVVVDEKKCRTLIIPSSSTLSCQGLVNSIIIAFPG